MERNLLAKYERLLECLELQDVKSLRLRVQQLRQVDGESWAIAEVIGRALDLMEGLGYRKLKGKPPLLSNEEIRSKVKGMPPKLFLFYESSYEESSIDWNEFIAKAQRELDIKYYEG